MYKIQKWILYIFLHFPLDKLKWLWYNNNRKRGNKNDNKNTVFSNR